MNIFFLFFRKWKNFRLKPKHPEPSGPPSRSHRCTTRRQNKLILRRCLIYTFMKTISMFQQHPMRIANAAIERLQLINFSGHFLTQGRYLIKKMFSVCVCVCLAYPWSSQNFYIKFYTTNFTHCYFFIDYGNFEHEKSEILEWAGLGLAGCALHQPRNGLAAY